MIFVQNKPDSHPIKLSQALLGDNFLTENNNNDDSFDFNRNNLEINKFRKTQIKPNDKLANFGKSIFSRTNYIQGYAKNNINSNFYITGCTPYNPYLIDACKQAIIHIKKDLPNYQEVINKINNEFGIEDNIKPGQEFNGYFTSRSFSNKNNKTVLPKIQSLTSTNNSLAKFSKTNLKTDINDDSIHIKDNNISNNKNKKISFDTRMNNLKRTK